jgi:NhaP-type Na+/H+ or K+/H+ antiporter
MHLASAAAAASGDLGRSLVAVVALGVGAQWLASRLRLPSILVLLAAGVLAGPDVSGLVDPAEMLGDLLFPVVSLAVGILLFEGGLDLRFGELRQQGGGVAVLRLVSIGALVTWLVGSAAAWLVVGLDTPDAALLGAVLVVSGPTVVIPLLRFARVREPLNGILRWEGIVIDPIGATVAVVVLRAVVNGHGLGPASVEVLATAGAGTAIGLIGAGVLTLAFARHWVPDELHNAVTLAVVVGVFAGADAVRPEAGLFAATVMGVGLANQRWAHVGHIQEFEENLGTLILASLFVLLGANVELSELVAWAPEALGLLACLVVVARPLAVWASTVGSSLTGRERWYLVAMAPRGIVAAAVSAVFALELAEVGRPVDALVPVTFVVIVGTVVLYGLAAKPAARRLQVARPEPRGVVFIGGPPWAIELGGALSDLDVPVLVVTRDRNEATAAAGQGLLTYTARLDGEGLLVALDTVGARLAIAASRTQELNAYGVRRAVAALGRANVYYMPRREAHGRGEADEVTRRPFGRRVTQVGLVETLAAGGRFVTVARPPAEDADADGPSERDDRAPAVPPPDAAELASLPEGALLGVWIDAQGIPSVPDHATFRPPPRGGSAIYFVPPAADEPLSSAGEALAAEARIPATAMARMEI